jgi:hypothetical protein
VEWTQNEQYPWRKWWALCSFVILTCELSLICLCYSETLFHSIKRIVFLDFIHRLVSREQKKLRKLKIIDKRTQYTRPQTNHTRIKY